MINSDLASTAMKNTPTIVVTGGYFLGVSWGDWVLILTAVYTALQIGDWVWTKIKLWRGRNVGTE